MTGKSFGTGIHLLELKDSNADRQIPQPVYLPDGEKAKRIFTDGNSRCLLQCKSRSIYEFGNTYNLKRIFTKEDLKALQNQI